MDPTATDLRQPDVRSLGARVLRHEHAVRHHLVPADQTWHPYFLTDPNLRLSSVCQDGRHAACGEWTRHVEAFPPAARCYCLCHQARMGDWDDAVLGRVQ